MVPGLRSTAMTQSPAPAAPPAEAPPPADHQPRRVLRRSLLAARIVAIVIFVLVITYGRGILFRSETFGGFYDAQAKALLHGHWDVEPSALSLEGFVIHGKTYEYFGPVPAIMRMPWFAVTDHGFGRLSALSMIVAFVLLVRQLARLIRRSIDAAVDVDSLDEPRARFVGWIAAALLLTFACGPPLFMASRPWAYHEASLWALAFMLWGFELLLAWRARPSVVVMLELLGVASLCVLTRGSLGFGLIAAIAAVVALEFLAPIRWQPIRRMSRWLARPDGPPRWRVLGAAAVLIPLGLYVGVNEAKFGSAFGLPIEAQVVSKFDPERIRALEANDGSLFSAGYLPTVLVEVIRPDGVAPRSVFPFVGFPRRGVTIIGDPVFDKLDVSTSLPASLPGPTLLAILAIWAAVRSRRWRRRLIVLLPLVGGAAVASVGVLTIGFIANRYLMDLFPLLCVLALGGFAVAMSRLTSSETAAPQTTTPERRRPSRRTWFVAATAVSTLWSVWTGTALALEYQRELSFGVGNDVRASWTELQADIGSLRGSVARHISADVALPRHVVRNEVLVVGDCVAVYRGDATSWREVWVSPDGGHVEVKVPASLLGDEPLIVADDGRGTQVALVRRGDRVRAVVSAPHSSGWTPGTGSAAIGDLDDGVLSVTVDPRIGFVAASLDDVELLSIVQPLDRSGSLQVRTGRQITPDRSLCRALGDD